MTEREKVVVSAYTGILLCDFQKLHEYAEEKLQRTIFTHEFATDSIIEELTEKAKDDLIKMCDKCELADKKQIEELGNLLYSLQEERNPFCLAELILKEGWGSVFCTKAHEKPIKEAKQKDEIIKRLIKKKNKLQAQIYKLKKENEK